MIIFWCIIAIMIMAAMTVVLFPLRHHLTNNFSSTTNNRNYRWLLVIIILIVLPIFALFFYAQSGDSQLLAAWLTSQQQTVAAQKLRTQLGTPQAVIAQLQQHLQQHPQSAQGWYWLGRLYLDQQQFPAASAAFATAYTLQPNNPDTMFQYAQALYLTRHSLNGQAAKILQQLLRLQPDNTLALNLLAVAAFQQGHYQHAIADWERILPHYSPNSPDGKALLFAIARAQTALTKGKE